MGEVRKALAKIEKRTKKITWKLGAGCLLLALFSVAFWVRPALTASVSANDVMDNYNVSGNDLEDEVLGYSLNTLYEATESISWSLKVDQSGGYILKIEGSGAIPDNFFEENTDLQAIKSIIRKMEIGAEITSIGTAAFQDFTYLESVTFEENSKLEVIGGAAFSGCTNLAEINLEDTPLKNIKFNDDSRHNLNGGAFYKTALKKVSLPATLERLGHAAFYSCAELEQVYFAENCNLNYLGAYSFRYNSALKSINFENCTADYINLATYPGQDGYYGSKYAVLENCVSLESVTIPSGFSGSLHAFADGCSSLKNVTVQTNSQITDLTNAFIDCTALEEIDLSPFTMSEDNSTAFDNTFAQCTALKRVVMPQRYSKELGPATFNGCTELSWENIDFGTMKADVEAIGKNCFNGIDVKNVDLSEWSALTTIGAYAFGNCAQLQKVILPNNLTTINEGAFSKAYFMKEIVLNSAGLSNLGINVFEGVPEECKLTVGIEVETLSGNLLASLAGHCGTVLFEGENMLQITEYPGGNGLAAPFTAMNGSFYADEKGVLYQLKEGEATVAYCPSGLSQCMIPAQITADAVYPVTEVGSNAFCQATDLIAISFEAPEQITLSVSAFAECKTLTSINEKTTVEEAKALFLDATAANAFYNTGLGGSNITLPDNGILTDSAIVLPNPSSTLKATIMTPTGYRTLEEKVYRYLTGEMANVQVSVELAAASDVNKKIRVYLAVEKEECEFGYVLGQEYTVDGVGCRLFRTDEDGIYCFEMDAPGSDVTVTIPVECKYPSPSSSGGKVQVWGGILSEDEVTALGNGVLERNADTSYYELQWYTVPSVFELAKEAQGGAEAYMDAASALWLRNLSYELSVSRVGEVIEGKGQDLVQSAEFSDVLSLPTGVTWREDVVQAIQESTALAPKWRYSYVNNIGAVYVSVADKDVLLCTLSGLEGVLKEMSPSVNGEGDIVLHWKVKNNNSVAEMNLPKATLSYGSQVLRLDMAQAGAVTGLTVDNQADVVFHYSYSEDKISQDSAQVMIPVGEGSISMKKSLTDRAEYWGEELEYTIRVTNPSAFAYEGMAQIADPLPTNTYLKVEEMERLLYADNGDRTSGKYLEIRIANALFVEPKDMETVVTVDGVTTAVTSMQNTGAVSVYNGLDTNPSILGTGNIVITQDEELLVVEALGESYTVGTGADYGSLQEALNAIGFVRDNATSYTLRWMFPEGEQTLNGGEELTYCICATAKDTFSMSSSTEHVDYRSFHLQELYGAVNIAYAHSKHTTNYGSANRIAVTPGNSDVNSPNIAREMLLNQTVSKNGELLGESFEITDGDVLQYTLRFEHAGTGTYDLLPLVDKITGTQILLAEYGANSGQSWAQEMTVETVSTIEAVDGPKIDRQYYVLDKPGTYEGVWIGGFYADSVIVSQTIGGGLLTQIKWYFSDMPAAAYSRSIKYRTLVNLERTNTESSKYSVSNLAWMNDQPGHRLHVAMIGSGSRMEFDKNIVESKGATPAEDVLVLEDYSRITAGEQVTYRLEIGNSGNAVVLEAGDYYDILPLTYGVFSWKKEDIELSYVCEGEEITLPSDWDVTTVTITDESENSYTEQRICWDSSVTFSGTGTLYIYVTLTYPLNDVSETWKNYVKENAGAVLYNTLFVHGLEASVSHELIEPGKVRLQKGVFRVVTGTYNKNNNNSEIRGTGDRFHYVNTTTRPYYVIYYVTLFNGGSTRLYLNDLYDRLPKGFEFYSLEYSVENRTSYYSVNSLAQAATNINYISTGEETYPIALMDGNDGAVDWVSTRVTKVDSTKEADGSVLLKFRFGGEDVSEELLYDEQKGMYYLNPGQGLRFGYTCTTGEAEYSEDVADNVIAMAYTDYLNAGTPSVDTENCSIPNTPSSGPLIENLPYNNGECYILSNAEAVEYGFAGGVGSTKWLASNVVVTRGEIIPGITKLPKYQIKDGSNGVEEYSGSVGPADVVRWELQASNSGAMPITDYTIEDTMASPYIFTGQVSFGIVDGKGSSGIYLENAGDYLFRILNRTENNGVTALELQNMLGEKKTVTLGGEPVSFEEGGDRFLVREDVDEDKYSEYTWNGTYQVSFGKNDAGNEVLRVRFTDKSLSIPEQSHVSLMVDTKNESGTYKNGTYTNWAMLTPNSQSYDADDIKQGNNVVDENGENLGVRNSGFINVASGFSTKANKSVTQDGETAGTELEKKYLVINKEKPFTYTLKVNGPKDQAMGQLVIIDSLPQVGDTGAFDRESGRNSAFQVDFAEEPNILVKVNDNLLDATEYEISYSEETDFSNTDVAWKGQAYEAWTASKTVASRSLRIAIVGSDKLPADAKIEVCFDATVADNGLNVEDEALPGEIAWNSFGYHYEAGGIYLSAAPLNVGVMIPEIPTLEKKVIKNDAPFVLSKNEEFNFLIYEGEEIAGLGKMTDESQIADKVSGRNYTIVSCMVQAGKSVSEPWQMEKPKQYSYEEATGEWKALADTWSWTQGSTYHVVELPLEGNIYRSMSPQTFVYDNATKVSIEALNEYILWDIVLQKTDAETQSLMLEDAIFGLYSLEEPSAEEKAALQAEIAALAIRIPPQEQFVYGEDAANWYLSGVASTDENGAIRWKGLDGDTYLVMELQAPDGYHMDNTPILAKRSELAVVGEKYVFEIKALNTTAYELPETGAKGVRAGYFAGILLCLFGGCCLYKYGKKKHEKM